MKQIIVITPAVESDGFMPMVADILKINEGRSDLCVSHVFVDQGPSALECYVDEVVAGVALVKAAIKAEEDGADGIVINCMADPALHAVREAVSTPVVGLAEVAMHTAAILGHKFGVIDILETTRTLTSLQAACYGLESRYRSFRSIDVPVLAIEDDPALTTERLVEEGLNAVMEDHVDVLILGCGTLLGPGLEMEKELKRRGLNVPVINPVPLAINTLLAIIQSGLTHSKQAYPTPAKRTIDAMTSSCDGRNSAPSHPS